MSCVSDLHLHVAGEQIKKSPTIVKFISDLHVAGDKVCLHFHHVTLPINCYKKFYFSADVDINNEPHIDLEFPIKMYHKGARCYSTSAK